MAASAIRCLRLLALGLIFSVLRYVLDNYLKLQGHKNIFQIIIDDDNSESSIATNINKNPSLILLELLHALQEWGDDASAIF